MMRHTVLWLWQLLLLNCNCNTYQLLFVCWQLSMPLRAHDERLGCSSALSKPSLACAVVWVVQTLGDGHCIASCLGHVWEGRLTLMGMPGQRFAGHEQQLSPCQLMQVLRQVHLLHAFHNVTVAGPVMHRAVHHMHCVGAVWTCHPSRPQCTLVGLPMHCLLHL